VTSCVTFTGQERYYAYGKDRLATAIVPTDNRFTGQKEDASGQVDSAVLTTSLHERPLP